jgi:LacI family transcriptional regulator, repressor for deo operon, udp, cdd, tsx, nupC, and nupG
MTISIQDVARQASVSVATVSRVFNLPHKVAPDTRSAVQEIAMKLGYVANASARTLRTQRSRVLGVVLPTLLNPVFAECLSGIASAATSAGYAISPITTNYELAQEDRAVNLLLAGNVDGMILVVSNPANSQALKRLQTAGLAYALAYNRHPNHPCVSVNSEAAVSAAVTRLAQLGHTRITLVSGQLVASDRAQQRLRGYQRAMSELKLKNANLLEVPFVESAAQQIRGLLMQKLRPTALVCSNDLLAIRCIRAAHLAGLNVPTDISVIGFDGIALGEDLTPVLSTITQPNSGIGRSAVELLVQALSSGSHLLPSASLTLLHGFRHGESFTAVPAKSPTFDTLSTEKFSTKKT